MTTNVLQTLNPTQESAPWGLTSLLAMVLRRIQGVFLPNAHQEARKVVLRACEMFGNSLLDADDLDDLDDRLDAVLYSSGFHELTTEILSLVQTNPETLQRLLESLDAKGPTIGDYFVQQNLPGAKAVLEGDRLEHAVARATIPVLLASPATMASAVEVAKVIMLTDLLADPSIPPEVLRCIVGSFRSTACLFALGELLQRDASVEPWLAQGIAERRRDGLRSYLVMVASSGKFQVSFDVVPAADRFDWEGVHARARKGVERLVDIAVDGAAPMPDDLE